MADYCGMLYSDNQKYGYKQKSNSKIVLSLLAYISISI